MERIETSVLVVGAGPVGLTAGLLLRRLGIDVEIVEQYAVDCSTGAYGPGDPAEIRDREDLYASHGLTLGPAFELRYWMQTH